MDEGWVVKGIEPLEAGGACAGRAAHAWPPLRVTFNVPHNCSMGYSACMAFIRWNRCRADLPLIIQRPTADFLKAAS